MSVSSTMMLWALTYSDTPQATRRGFFAESSFGHAIRGAAAGRSVAVMPGGESRMHITEAAKRGEVPVTWPKYVKYHGATPPPPNGIAHFLGPFRPSVVVDAVTAAAELERWLVARRPSVALSHWRRRAEERIGITRPEGDA